MEGTPISWQEAYDSNEICKVKLKVVKVVKVVGYL